MFTAESLVFDSFLHSQGNNVLQSQILMWLDEKDILTYEQSLAAMRTIAPRLINYASRSQHISVEEERLTALLGGLEEISDEARFTHMADNILRRDKDCLTACYKRPERAVYGGRVNPSHGVLFGLLGASTGSSVYDALYTEQFENFKNPLPTAMRGETTQLLGEVILLHTSGNPQDAAQLAPITELVIAHQMVYSHH